MVTKSQNLPKVAKACSPKVTHPPGKYLHDRCKIQIFFMSEKI